MLLRGGHEARFVTEPKPNPNPNLCQVDPRIALVLIFAERKLAKDSSVLAFLRLGLPLPLPLPLPLALTLTPTRRASSHH